jgi:hypothetical protein
VKSTERTAGVLGLQSVVRQDIQYALEGLSLRLDLNTVQRGEFAIEHLA